MIPFTVPVNLKPPSCGEEIVDVTLNADHIESFRAVEKGIEVRMVSGRIYHVQYTREDFEFCLKTAIRTEKMYGPRS